MARRKQWKTVEQGVWHVWDTRGVSVEFWWGGRKEGDHLEDLDVGGRLILKWILKMWDDSMDWIDLTQDRDRRKAFVNAVMNLRVS